MYATTTKISGLWEDVKCSGDGILGFSCDDIERCKDEAVGNAFGAFTTCATLIFAMAGLLTRIRRKADSNFQKVIGCVPVRTLNVLLRRQHDLTLTRTGRIPLASSPWGRP